MACRVRYLNSAGILPREVPGIDALAGAFPEHWLLYASFECFTGKGESSEIDAMVVMDDRVLLLEIKDWSGELEVNGDVWSVNGRSRGRSPVQQIQMKARKLGPVLSRTIPKWSMQNTVSSRVVLTGTCLKSAVPAEERDCVLTLEEAKSIADPTGFKQHFGTKKLLAKKPYEFEADFERITRSPKHFAPLERLWQGFRVTDEDYVVHPRGLWREHRAERARDSRTKGLVRIWSFDRLAVGLNTPENRMLVAEREARALAHLEDLKSGLVPSGILMPFPHDYDEVLTQHVEVRRLPAGWTTLDRFLERAEDDLLVSDRALAAATLINAVGELHDHGIAHRDLGERNVWVGGPTQQALTGFMACQIPNDVSVAPWLDELRFYPPIGDAGPLSPKQMDVAASARLALQIVSGTRVNDVDRVLQDLPTELHSLKPWFGRALRLEGAQPFAHGREAAEEFGRLLDARDADKVDNALLDGHDGRPVPSARWEAVEHLSHGSKHVWRALDADGTSIIVKVWYGWRRGTRAGDLALMRLLQGIARIRQAARPDLPDFIDAGLSPAGVFVAYRETPGVLWSDAGAGEPITDAVAACTALVRAVDALHDMDIEHGDVAGRNIVQRAGSGEVVLIDLFDFSEVGHGRIEAGALRPENAEQLTVREIDRYAVVRLVIDRLSALGDASASELIGELEAECAREKIELLAPILDLLEGFSAAAHAAERQTFRIAVLGVAPGPLQSETAPLFARARMLSNGNAEYRLAGLERELILEAGPLGAKAPRVAPVEFQALSRASEHGVPLDINVVVDPSAMDGTASLLALLRPLITPKPLRTPRDAERSPVGDEPLDVPRYWRRLIELEEEHQPRVTILRELDRTGEFATYAYERGGVDFDFDPDEQVEVRIPGGARIGDLELSALDHRTLVIRHRNKRRLLPGDQVLLAERRARTSFDRRSRAVERVLKGKATVPNIINYFIPGAEARIEELGPSVSDEELKPYRLNDGQRGTFRQVARHGPLGLVQGPPGTGKTRFIAAFVHWLLSKQGAENILIASQSHEAVNNAIEALVDLCKAQGGPRPSLLRIGSKGITDKIRPFHTRALREGHHVRFEAAFKSRVVGIAAKLGIRRSLAQDAVDLDRKLGFAARRLISLRKADAQGEAGLNAEERRRNERILEAVTQAFDEAALEYLEVVPEEASPEQVLDEAFSRLAAIHDGISPSDIRKLRRLIDLAGDWSASLTSPHRNFEEFLAKTRSVVAATCVGIGQTKIRVESKVFDWVIVDEAARCTASELAIPLQVGRRILMVGDHLQLRPMIDRPVIDGLANEMEGVDVRSLGQSDFERAFISSYGAQHGNTLTEQYRMDPAICAIVSEIFYIPHRVRLETSPDRVADPAFAELAPPLDRPATWIDTSTEPDHQELAFERDPTTLWNPAEVRLTMRLLEHVAANSELTDALSRGREAEPIGIICMYRGQKVMMEQAFADGAWDPRFRRMVRIDTVDSYQGKENTIIVLSLVRSNPKLKRGHVASHNRCNVALSRARERLYILGAKSMWNADLAGDPMSQVCRYFDKGLPDARFLAPSDLA